MSKTLTGRCRHYWEVANGKSPVVKGVCKLCGAEREFPNHFSGCFGPEDEDFRQQLDREARLEERTGRRA